MQKVCKASAEECLSLWGSGVYSIFMKEILDLILLIACFKSDAKDCKTRMLGPAYLGFFLLEAKLSDIL